MPISCGALSLWVIGRVERVGCRARLFGISDDEDYGILGLPLNLQIPKTLEPET